MLTQTQSLEIGDFLCDDNISHSVTLSWKGYGLADLHEEKKKKKV